MREIKFRGYDEDNKQWVFGYYHKALGEWLGYNPFNLASAMWFHGVVSEGVFTHVDEKSVGQYTGLKDKNGKEIYEGDILRSGGDSMTDREVIFEDGAFCFFENDNHANQVLRAATCKRLEIVGNIHENLELLEESDE